MGSPTSVHRELLLPPPSEKPPQVVPLVWSWLEPIWLEVHRDTSGRVRYAIGSALESTLEGLIPRLENARPRLRVGPPIPCPLSRLLPGAVLARAMPGLKHHHLPMGVRPAEDAAGLLIRTLGSAPLRDHDAVVQILFRRVRVWESGFFSPTYESVRERHSQDVGVAMDARRADAAYHVELRTRIYGPRPWDALTALEHWLENWTTYVGDPWRWWDWIEDWWKPEFETALAAHDMTRFATKKARRDVSATELAHLIGVPWAVRHAECSYAGAPSAQPRPDLVVAPRRAPAVGSASPAVQSRLELGTSGPHRVALPKEWHHLVVLGRTQSGKSTLALNLVLQILWQKPQATVVVIEPTGRLVEGIVTRLSATVAADAIEIDPAHTTFQKDGTTMVSVPLSLLGRPEGLGQSLAEQERWAETLASDLLTAIRNAWGEESIGGRAELVLRALVQGLSQTLGSNLVDAYHILSSKQALQRFVRSAPPGPLRNFLEAHLPRFGYDFTMSSLDKVGKIATNPLLRVALCQRAHPVGFDVLLRHRLLLLNLSKAAVGSDGANFLGAVYLTQLWSALQRTGPPDRPVYLILDEVHNYAIPALADMLSEGAKFGVHVVAVTQFLNRVPARLRGALVGNVDAWLLFALGAEDMEDAWKLVNGQTHGWRPEDLVDGLRPHEVAMSVSGGLLKLVSCAAPPPDPRAAERKAAVLASSRRYAQLEDSEASPWLVGQEEVEGTLRSLSGGPRTHEELETATSLSRERLDATLTRAAVAGDLVQGATDGRFHLTARGSVHLKALQNRMNEGEEHVETLVEFAMFLQTRGIALSVPKQVAGVLTPDGQFQWGDAIYNVEVECSTVKKDSAQVVRNVKKGRSAGYRVLILLPNQSGVPRALQVLEKAFPGLRLWTDGVGMVWREGRGAFRASAEPGTKGWTFLERGSVAASKEATQEAHGDPLPIELSDPFHERLRAAIGDLVATGRFHVTTKEIFAVLPRSERERRTDEQVGAALRGLGYPHTRVRADGRRIRVYDVTPVAGPESRSATGPRESGDSSDPSRWSASSPIERGEGGPADQDGPAD
jgi:hypothetical protein